MINCSFQDWRIDWLLVDGSGIIVDAHLFEPEPDPGSEAEPRASSRGHRNAAKCHCKVLAVASPSRPPDNPWEA